MFKNKPAISIQKQGLPALLASSVLMASALLMPALAFAENAVSQTGSGTNGTGVTALNMITEDDGGEHTETGDNVAFTFPSSINYVVNADGSLIGPSGDITFFGNSSSFPIHVSSVKTSALNDWSFVEDISTVGSATNCVELNLGPDATGTQVNSLNVAEFESKVAGTDNIPSEKAAAWSMGVNGKVGLASQGSVANVSQDITSSTRFGTVQWFVRAGSAV